MVRLVLTLEPSAFQHNILCCVEDYMLKHNILSSDLNLCMYYFVCILYVVENA